MRLDAAKMVKTEQSQTRHEKVEAHTIGTGPGSLSHICAAAREGGRQRDCGSAAALNSGSATEFKIPLFCYFAIHREHGAKPTAPRPVRRRPPPRPLPGRGPPRAKMPLVGQRRPALPRTDSAVPSALGGLTSGFGMGPGVPPLPWSLTNKGHCVAVPSGPHSVTSIPPIARASDADEEKSSAD